MCKEPRPWNRSAYIFCIKHVYAVNSVVFPNPPILNPLWWNQPLRDRICNISLGSICIFVF